MPENAAQTARTMMVMIVQAPNITEKFCGRAALGFIGARSLSLQFSQLCLHVCLLCLRPASSIIIGQSNALPRSCLGTGQEQLPAVPEGKSKVWLCWTAMARATPMTAPEAMIVRCTWINQNPPGKAQLASQWERVEGH